MKKRRSILSIVLILFLLFNNSPFVFAANFRDTRGHWAEEYIDYLSNAGVLKGYENGSFKPNSSISKVEFYSMVNKAAGLKKTYTVTFSDVSKSKWYYNEVAKAIKAGYITPTTGRLRPEAPISRQEAMRILGYMYNMNASDGILNNFSDQGQIKSSARGAIAALVEVGAISGYENGTFRPNNAISRGEVAKIFSLLLDSYGRPSAKSVLDSKIRFGSRNLHE